MAENILLKRVNIITWRQLQQAQDGIILDVRTPDEFSLGAIPGAVNIPIDGIRDRLNEIPQDKNIYIYCAVGLRGYLASRVLMQHVSGFKYREIADKLNLPLGTVKSRIFFTRQRLQQQLKDFV